MPSTPNDYVRFKEVIICADWGSCAAGNYLAISGSKGSIAIYYVDLKN